MISNSLNHRYFQMKTDMNVKIGSYAKLCMQNEILASKIQNIKQQKISVFAPLILKRWISCEKTTAENTAFTKASNLRISWKRMMSASDNEQLCSNYNMVSLKRKLEKQHNMAK